MTGTETTFLSTLADVADLGGTVVVVIGLLLVVPKLVRSFFEDRKADRETEMTLREGERNLQIEQLRGLLSGFERFGDRVAAAVERQAVAMERTSAAQEAVGAQLGRKIDALELAQKVTYAAVERVAAQFANAIDDKG